MKKSQKKTEALPIQSQSSNDMKTAKTYAELSIKKGGHCKEREYLGET